MICITNIIVNESEITFNRSKKEIYAAACKMAYKTLVNILEEMDKKLAKERDKSRYRHKCKRQITIKMLMGEVTFERAVYERIDDKEKNICYCSGIPIEVSLC